MTTEQALQAVMTALLPEGTLVCLKVGGPLMTVEQISGEAGVVATVWFQGGVVHRDMFSRRSLMVLQRVPELEQS